MPSVGVSVALDLFPARVTLPSGVELNPVRVYVADGNVQVYIVRNGKPVLYYDEPMTEARGSAVRGYSLRTADGDVVVEKTTGCGCGHPLKTYNPWPGQRRSLAKLPVAV